MGRYLRIDYRESVQNYTAEVHFFKFTKENGHASTAPDGVFEVIFTLRISQWLNLNDVHSIISVGKDCLNQRSTNAHQIESKKEHDKNLMVRQNKGKIFLLEMN